MVFYFFLSLILFLTYWKNNNSQDGLKFAGFAIALAIIFENIHYFIIKNNYTSKLNITAS